VPIDDRPLAAVAHVKMRRRMIVVEHGDDDAKEAADFRHATSCAVSMSCAIERTRPDANPSPYLASAAGKIDLTASSRWR
jgi:hypothetical protein